MKPGDGWRVAGLVAAIFIGAVLVGLVCGPWARGA